MPTPSASSGGYDADHLREAVLARAAEPVIPPKSNRRAALPYDRARCACWSPKPASLKQFRRVATRYGKLLANYRGFVILAAIAILPR